MALSRGKTPSDREIRGELDFFVKAGRLKYTGRRGWTFRGVEIPESVAAHSYRTALLGMYYGKKFGLNTCKVVSLALLHDLNEAESWDTVADRFSKLPEEKKIAKGLSDLKVVLASLPKEVQKEYASLWLEENRKASLEGKLARELNKIELAMQALDYETAGHPGETLEDLWEHVRASVKDARLRRILAILKKMRPKK
jgi:putative hydrolase of HD superfamily